MAMEVCGTRENQLSDMYYIYIYVDAGHNVPKRFALKDKLSTS